jgi:hypothetical protein
MVEMQKDKHVDIAVCTMHLVMDKASDPDSLICFAPASFLEAQGILFGSTTRMEYILLHFFGVACISRRDLQCSIDQNTWGLLQCCRAAFPRFEKDSNRRLTKCCVFALPW